MSNVYLAIPEPWLIHLTMKVRTVPHFSRFREVGEGQRQIGRARALKSSRRRLFKMLRHFLFSTLVVLVVTAIGHTQFKGPRAAVDCQSPEIRNPELDDVSAKEASLDISFARNATGVISLKLLTAQYNSESFGGQSTVLTVDESKASKVAGELFERHKQAITTAVEKILKSEHDQAINGEIWFLVFSYRSGCLSPTYTVERIGNRRPNL